MRCSPAVPAFAGRRHTRPSGHRRWCGEQGRELALLAPDTGTRDEQRHGQAADFVGVKQQVQTFLYDVDPAEEQDVLPGAN